MGKAAFLTSAEPLRRSEQVEEAACRACPHRPAVFTRWRLCQRHNSQWYHHRTVEGEDADFNQWLAAAESFDGYGSCQVAVCSNMASSPLGLCSGHETRYQREGRPGGACLPPSWAQRFELRGHAVPVSYSDEPQFRGWCVAAAPTPWPGQVNLRGLRPLLRAEIQWTLFAYAQQPRPGRWDLAWIQKLANTCRDRRVNSLVDLDLADFPRFSGGIARAMPHHLRLVYFTPADSRDAGFLETDHFGVRFPHRASHVDLTEVSQRWLRDLLWDYLAELLRSPHCPRSAMPIDSMRRACTELSAFVETDAPNAGHDPTQLRAEHTQRFVADQRRRERDSLPSLAMKGPDGAPSTVTANTRAVVFNHARKLLRDALETGAAERLGVDREFITAIPAAGGGRPGRAG